MVFSLRLHCLFVLWCASNAATFIAARFASCYILWLKIEIGKTDVECFMYSFLLPNLMPQRKIRVKVGAP